MFGLDDQALFGQWIPQILVDQTTSQNPQVLGYRFMYVHIRVPVKTYDSNYHLQKCYGAPVAFCSLDMGWKWNCTLSNVK